MMCPTKITSLLYYTATFGISSLSLFELVSEQSPHLASLPSLCPPFFELVRVLHFRTSEGGTFSYYSQHLEMKIRK